MTFVVNAEKKRNWNKMWWRDWPQGRVLLVLSVASMIVFVAALAHMLLTVDFSLALSDRWSTPDYDPAVAGDAQGSLILHAAVLALTLVLSCLIVPVVRYRRHAQDSTSAESLEVADGVLTYSFHDPRDSKRRSLWQVCARLDGCVWWWDAKRRELVVDAREQGALREWRYGDPSREAIVPFERMEPTDTLRMCPFFDPDPIEYLRQIGAPEGKPRSARWEM
ncbi:hypothetical protein [Thermophilibacter sp.]